MRHIILFAIIFGVLYAPSYAALSDNELKQRINNVQSEIPSGIPVAPSGNDQKGFVGEFLAGIFTTSGKLKNEFVNSLRDIIGVGNTIPKWDGEKFQASSISEVGGNVGIRDTTPSYDLDVNGDINFTGDLYNNGVRFGGLWQENGSNIHRNTGNVGIGTSNPTSKLHVVGDTRITGNLIMGGTLNGDSITDNTIDSSEIQNNTLTADDLAANSVGTSEIINNSVTSADILNNTITELDISDSFKARDSNLLDGLDSTAFIRSNADDTFTGKLSVGNTNNRRAGMYGIYDSNRTGHIWSMGSAYQIPQNGSDFGNLYGFGYKHTNNPTGGAMAGGHQAVWAQNGTPYVALGNNIWTRGYVDADNGVRVDGISVIGGDAWVEGDRIRQNSIDGSEIQNESITAADLAANSVGTSEVANNSLTANDLAANSVGNSELIDNPTFTNVTITSTPTAGNHAATKAYVDSRTGGATGDTDWTESATTVTTNRNVAITGSGLYKEIRMGNSGGADNFIIHSSPTSTTGPGFYYNDYGNAGDKFYYSKNSGWTSEGNINAQGFVYTSDKRLKEDIKTTDGLDTINKLRGVDFTWKNNGHLDTGFIAQEVEKVLPHLVKTDTNTGFKSVSYGNIIGPLVEAVKEQQEQIEILRGEIELLKNK